MTSAPESLPSDLAAAHAMILAERAARLEAEAKLANARAEAALITYYKLDADSDGSRSGIPTRSRPSFRFDAGHHSEMNSATIPI